MRSLGITRTPCPRASRRVARRTELYRFSGPAALMAEPGRMEPVTTTGLGLFKVRLRKYAVSSSVSVPWVTTTPSTAGSASRSEEHTSELQSLMRISYDVFCLKKKNYLQYNTGEHLILL